MRPASETTEIRRLHSLIDRYFDATATEDEERELMKALASTDLSTEKIEEARAVAGFYAVGRAKERRRMKPASHRNWQRAAASVAVALVCGAAILFFSGHSDVSPDRCIAYIGEETITDSQMVLAMMQSDLDEINEVTQSLRADANAEISSFSDMFSL